MNKRRRFGAKRRRREARLKQMWMSGMSVDAFFRRVLGHRGRPMTITGRFRTTPELQRIPAVDLHQMRANADGVSRSVAKARNYADLYRITPGHADRLGIKT